MGKRWVLGLVCVVLLVGGCAWVREQLGYHNVSKATPLTQGERSPSDRAKDDASPLAAIPVWGGALAMVASFVLGKIYEVQRGKSIVKGTPATASPVNPIVKAVAGISSAVFEIGADGSAVKRSWKAMASGLLAYGLTLIPMIHAWAATNNTKFGATLLTLSALILGAEKALSNAAPKPVA